jgi:hypothetical protein
VPGIPDKGRRIRVIIDTDARNEVNTGWFQVWPSIAGNRARSGNGSGVAGQLM